MKISMKVDIWSGNKFELKVVENPTTEEILRLFSMLDGKRSTILCATLENGDEFVVGGGPRSYVMYKAAADETVEDIYFDTSLKGTSRLFIGGQPGDYENSMLFPRAAAQARLLDWFQSTRDAN